jgi:hypothetical protein
LQTTSGLFTTHGFTIPAKYNQQVRLIFWGDVHRDSPNHANRAWQNFLDYCRPLKDTWYFGMGDYVDSGSTSERDCVHSILKRLHEGTKIDLSVLAQAKVDLLEEELGFMRGHLIGLLNGNHYWQFEDGTNTDQKLCGALNEGLPKEKRCKYLGVSSFVRLTFDISGRRHTLDIWAHHGKGASRFTGTSIKRVEEMQEYALADIFVMGHDHKRAGVPGMPKLFLRHAGKSGLKICEKQPWVIRSGSFLASYEDGKPNYNVDAGRGPCSLGHVELLITPKLHAFGSRKNERHIFEGFEIRSVS